jgi:Spy/CpxP family protein refolding chaperone
MMKRALGSLGIAAIVAFSAGPTHPAIAHADEPDTQSAGPACPDPAVPVVAAALELNPDQLRAWLSILAARGEVLGPLAEQIRQRRQALAAQLQGGSPDPTVVGQLFIEIHALEAQVQAVHAEVLARFREILTIAQNRKLDLIRQGARVCPVVPAFATVGLITDFD